MKNLLAILSSVNTMDSSTGSSFMNVEPAKAKTLRAYKAQWSGADFGNGATVIATIMLDSNLINTSGFTGSSVGVGAAFHSIKLKVTGAANPEANGLFTTTDFSRAVLNFLGSVDLNVELVGQAGFSSAKSEFNLFRSTSNPLAPTATSFNKLRVFGREEVVLTSFAPVVVEETVSASAVNFPILLDMGNMALYSR